MEVIATSLIMWDLMTCHSWSILNMHTEFSHGRELLCFWNTFWRILLYSSGHVRLYYPVDSWCWWVEVAPECPRGRPSWCMTQTTLAHNKAGHRGADFCLGRLLPPAPTADVGHESQHCLSAAMPTTRPADVTRILMKIQDCLNLCLETNAGCCGRFFHSCKRF